jgi:hypothetical protein
MNKKPIFLSLIWVLLIGGCTTAPLPGANEGSWQGEKIQTYPREKILSGEVTFTIAGDTVNNFRVNFSFYSAVIIGGATALSSCEVDFPPMKINPNDYSFSNPQITSTPPWVISNFYDLRPHTNSLFGKFETPQKASGFFYILSCTNRGNKTIYEYIIGERDAWIVELIN